MAFTPTQDTRPTILGNLMLIHGTYANDSGSVGGLIPLGDYLSQIIAAGASTDGGVTAVTHTLLADAMAITTGADEPGVFWALGIRA